MANNVGDFLAVNCREHFGFEFSAVSRTVLIQHGRAKLELQLAENEFEAGDYEKAAEYAAIAVKAFLGDMRKRLEEMNYRRSTPLPDDVIDRDVANLIERLEPRRGGTAVRRVNEVWRAATERLNLMSLGIDPVAEAAFDRVSPNVMLTLGGKAIVYARGDSTLVCTKDNVAFCLEFAFSTIWRLESLPMIRGANVSHAIQATRWTETFLVDASGLTQAGLVEKGTRIQAAEYGLGRAGLERVWAWTADNGVRVMADFDAFVTEP